MEILPVIDTEVLKQKANEAAMKGALKEIEEFYTGYNSPFRKKIKEELEKQEIGFGLELPDIISLINEHCSNEINNIANTAIAKSFVPTISRFLTRVEKEIKFSEILKEFVTIAYDRNYKDDLDYDSFNISVEEDPKYGWLNIEMYYNYSKKYAFTLHLVHETKNDQVKKYQLFRLPHGTYDSKSIMKIETDNAKIEVPFVSDVLADEFASYLARIIICKSFITMDTTIFTDDMFPQDECHCH